jgi:hypothetical protein
MKAIVCVEEHSVVELAEQGFAIQNLAPVPEHIAVPGALYIAIDVSGRDKLFAFVDWLKKHPEVHYLFKT